jgi:peptidyl-prolyl cis-trans isomerase B (cyclophilin B)|nr:peptidylprolyl isomerase [Candidatus Krumholzibacteria bacterium]
MTIVARRLNAALGLAMALTLVLTVLAVPASATETFARLETEEGNILLVFYPELAPHHVDNFVHLSRTGFYDGTRFHRIVPGFVIQGGDPNSKDDDPRNDGMGGPTLADILGQEEAQLVNELNAKLEAKGYAGIQGQAQLKAEFSKTAKHMRGSLSMARSREVDSAGSQFFICADKTSQLDGQYTIFGQVVSGIEVADVIVGAEKNPAAGRDAPAFPVAIKKVTIIEGTDDLTVEEKAAWEAMPAGLKNVK